MTRTSRDLLRRMAGAPIVVEGQVLDVHTQVLLDGVRRLGIPTPEDVEEARRQADVDVVAVEPSAPAMATERDVLVPGPSAAMRVRVYGPKTARPNAGLLVYFHGGGFVTGSIRSHDAAVRMLAHESGVVIAAVEYRLGPEAMFPRRHRRCARRVPVGTRARRGLRCVSRDRVGVGGDSAGGNMSAVISHLARDHGKTPSHQLLIYPAIDWSRSCATHRTFAKGFFLEESRTFWYEKHYLHSIEERDDPRASPIRFKDFSRLPPATIVTAGFDILRDEGLWYAETLVRAGTPVDYCCERSLIHGFFNMSGVLPAASTACSRIARRLREALG